VRVGQPGRSDGQNPPLFGLVEVAGSQVPRIGRRRALLMFDR